VIRCLHLADLHLGWSLQDPDFPSDKSRVRREERDSVLKTAVDFAVDPGNSIDIVIIAGTCSRPILRILHWQNMS